VRKIETEELIEDFYELDNEYKIPLIDEEAYAKLKVKKRKALATVIFNAHKSPDVIEGFLKLADYFKSIILKKKKKFFIVLGSILFVLDFKE